MNSNTKKPGHKSSCTQRLTTANTSVCLILAAPLQLQTQKSSFYKFFKEEDIAVLACALIQARESTKIKGESKRFLLDESAGPIVARRQGILCRCRRTELGPLAKPGMDSGIRG